MPSPLAPVASQNMRSSGVATGNRRGIDKSVTPPPVNPPIHASMVNYGAVDALRGVDLLRGLATITAQGHVPHKYFEASNELFGHLDDLDGNDRIIDVYSGREVGPIGDNEAAWDKDLSVEHTWPQSRGARGTAQADLHHLRVADRGLNGLRSNLPFGDVVTNVRIVSPNKSPWQSKLGETKDGITAFEPDDEIKGDIARGMLYFATRYSSTVQRAGVSPKNFFAELPTLLKWHELDPVTDAERSRNDAVAAYQGNRNPYVDHPEYVQRIGADGFAAFRAKV